MNGRFLLDTNIIIALFAQDISVQKHLAEAQEVFVPIVTLGELYYGAQKSAHIEANLLRINKFAEGNVVLFCDIETAQQYGHIKNSLSCHRDSGRVVRGDVELTLSRGEKWK